MKPFSKIAVLLNIDARGLRAHTEIDGLDFDGMEKMNKDPVANRRAMYAAAGKLATAGYDVYVQSVGAPVPLRYEVVVECPAWVDEGPREAWARILRRVWENVCGELGLDCVG